MPRPKKEKLKVLTEEELREAEDAYNEDQGETAEQYQEARRKGNDEQADFLMGVYYWRRREFQRFMLTQPNTDARVRECLQWCQDMSEGRKKQRLENDAIMKQAADAQAAAVAAARAAAKAARAARVH